MQLSRIRIHNFRSIIDSEIEVQRYSLLVGANNAGKSTIINAIRAFYDDITFNYEKDFPKAGWNDNESWVELTFDLSDSEDENLPEKYRNERHQLTVRKVLYSENKEQFKAKQSNIYAVHQGELDKELFFGAKNISQGKLGDILYIPAASNATDTLKTTGPSPLREIINFVFKRQLESNKHYQAILTAISTFDKEANKEDGVISSIVKPINAELSDWKIKMGLQIDSLSPDDITKNLIKHHFMDEGLNGERLPLEQYGHGFQRSLIFNLLRVAASFKDEKPTTGKEFKPDFTLLLFEEPEAYLHPTQQEQMFNNLRRLANLPGNQVIVTSHSSHFVSKSSADLGQLVRVCKKSNQTKAYQVTQGNLDALLKDGAGLLSCLQAFVDNDQIPDELKKKAREMIKSPPTEEIATQEERFRFQLWINSERSKMFFSEHVIIAEGATEKALLEYLLNEQWSDLLEYKLYILDSMGKFNIHRYISLLTYFGINHTIIIDSDNENGMQGAINDFLASRATEFTCGSIFKFDGDLESQLGISKIKGRDDKKPVEILKAIQSNLIPQDKLDKFREEIETRLVTAVAKVPKAENEVEVVVA